MFRVSRCARIGSFSMFMIQEKKNPILTALPVSQRGKKLGEMYRALTPQEIEKLNTKAKKYKPSAATIRRKVQRLKRRSQATQHIKMRGAEEYNHFLKIMHERYAKLPEADRFTKLIERFERSYGKPVKPLKKQKRAAAAAPAAAKTTKRSMKKAIKKNKAAAKPKVQKKKAAAKPKKVKAPTKTKKARKSRAKKTLRKRK